MTMGLGINTHWTEEETELLKARWGQAGNSASAIAAELTRQFGSRRNRSMVLGRAHRLGLPRLAKGGSTGGRPRGDRPRRERKRAADYRIKAPPGPKRTPKGVIFEEAGPNAKPFMETTGCLYPVAGDLYCNEPGKPWCEKHRRIVYPGHRVTALHEQVERKLAAESDPAEVSGGQSA